MFFTYIHLINIVYDDKCVVNLIIGLCLSENV